MGFEQGFISGAVLVITEGFVCVNGAYRGGAYQTSVAVRVRCAGNRYNDTPRRNASTIIGFRLNGVYRCGGESTLAGYLRCGGYRMNYSRAYVHRGIGFRLNGVYVAGCYKSGKTLYVRAGFRGYWDDRGEVGEQIGFRL